MLSKVINCRIVDAQEIDDAQNELRSIGNYAHDWDRLRCHVNKLLQHAGVNEDKQMGPFFLSASELKDEESFIEAIKSKVLMYLFEDAVKTKRTYLFDSNVVTVNRYSDICKGFRDKGLKIFGENFKAEYDNQKNELDDKKQQNSERSQNESDDNFSENM